jgi:hypothetical protein
MRLCSWPGTLYLLRAAAHQDTDGPAATARLPVSRQLRLRSKPQQLNCATETCQLASTLLSPFVHSGLHSTHLTTLQREGGWRQTSGKTPRGGCAAPSLYMFCLRLGARHLCSAPLCQAHVRCILQYACALGAAARQCLESACVPRAPASLSLDTVVLAVLPRSHAAL